MSFERQFRTMMPHTVTVRTLASKSADGSPTYSTAASTYTARVVTAQRQIRDGSGNVKMAAFDVWIASTGSLSPQSRFTLPDGSSPPVLSLSSYPDEDGTHHTKVVFGH